MEDEQLALTDPTVAEALHRIAHIFATPAWGCRCDAAPADAPDQELAATA